MTDLTVIADALAVAKPCGLLLDLGDRRSLAPYCCVLPVRSIAGYFLLAGRSLAAFPFSGAHDLCPDCLACLRPSERMSGSQAWSQ